MNKLLGIAIAFALTCTSAFAASEAELKVLSEKMVKDGIAMAEEKGDKAVIDAVNNKDPKFIQGEVYLIIYDTNGVCKAHATQPKRVGENQMESEDKSPQKIKFIKERVDLAKKDGKGWQTYVWSNPETKTNQKKNNYVELYKGLIFSAGYYIAD